MTHKEFEKDVLKQFDEKFNDDFWAHIEEDELYSDAYSTPIKSFISQLIQEVREDTKKQILDEYKRRFYGGGAPDLRNSIIDYFIKALSPTQ